MRVLVVEDQERIASFIEKGLKEQGFVVDVCGDGDDGYGLALTEPYDAMVLDIMLPGRDGLSILKNLRKKGMSVPVILLTARGELDERLEGSRRLHDEAFLHRGVGCATAYRGSSSRRRSHPSAQGAGPHHGPRRASCCARGGRNPALDEGVLSP